MASKPPKWLSEKALATLRHMPRVAINNLKPHPPPALGSNGDKPRAPRKHGRASPGGKMHGWIKNEHKNQYHHRIGFEAFKTPMAYKTKREPSYNYGWESKRQYPPLSLKTLQLMIDTGRLDASKPIDLSAIVNTKVFPIEPSFQHFGVNLTDEGADYFASKVNIEVQWANEQSIAAIEKNGGVITTAYYDISCVTALINPQKWFKEGKPIPRRLHPPADCIRFYSGAENRGYLADPRLVAEERMKLAQKYGYEINEISEEYLKETKDPKQTFYGLEPGWIVDLKDKVIFKPTKDSELYKFYTRPTQKGEPIIKKKILDKDGKEVEERLKYPPYYPHYLPPNNKY